jgi:hypothetical protein
MDGEPQGLEQVAKAENAGAQAGCVAVESRAQTGAVLPLVGKTMRWKPMGGPLAELGVAAPVELLLLLLLLLLLPPPLGPVELCGGGMTPVDEELLSGGGITPPAVELLDAEAGPEERGPVLLLDMAEDELAEAWGAIPVLLRGGGGSTPPAVELLDAEAGPEGRGPVLLLDAPVRVGFPLVGEAEEVGAGAGENVGEFEVTAATTKKKQEKE